MLGTTGTGKSTTIHYLCYSDMEHETINGIPNITAKKVYVADL
jgi:hypothetical protein